MSNLDGIFLDFYGTLASGDRAAVVAICARVIADHHLPTTPDELAVLWGRRYFAAIEDTDTPHFRLLSQIEHDTLIETVSGFGVHIDPDPYIVQFNEYLARPTLFEEVREVLDGLRVPVCIVSNADEKELRNALEYHRLDIPYVVTSETAESYKPDARIFRYALEVTGWRPERVIHVGDSLHSDVGGAKPLGIRTVWVHRSERITDIGTETPDMTWPDLRPLLEIAG